MAEKFSFDTTKLVAGQITDNTDPRKGNVQSIFNATINEAGQIVGAAKLLDESRANEILAEIINKAGTKAVPVVVKASDTIDLNSLITNNPAHITLPPAALATPENVAIKDVASYIVWEESGKKMAKARGNHGADGNATKLGYADFGSDLETSYNAAIGSLGSVQEKVNMTVKYADAVVAYKTQSANMATALDGASSDGRFANLDRNIDKAVDDVKTALAALELWRGTTTPADKKGDIAARADAETAIAAANTSLNGALKTCGDNPPLEAAIRQKVHQKIQGDAALLAEWQKITVADDKNEFGKVENKPSDNDTLRAMLDKSVIDRSLGITNDPALGVTFSGAGGGKSPSSDGKGGNGAIIAATIASLAVAGAGATMMGGGGVDENGQAAPKRWTFSRVLTTGLGIASAALLVNAMVRGEKGGGFVNQIKTSLPGGGGRGA